MLPNFLEYVSGLPFKLSIKEDEEGVKEVQPYFFMPFNQLKKVDGAFSNCKCCDQDTFNKFEEFL